MVLSTKRLFASLIFSLSLASCATSSNSTGSSSSINTSSGNLISSNDNANNNQGIPFTDQYYSPLNASSANIANIMRTINQGIGLSESYKELIGGDRLMDSYHQILQSFSPSTVTILGTGVNSHKGRTNSPNQYLGEMHKLDPVRSRDYGYNTGLSTALIPGSAASIASNPDAYQEGRSTETVISPDGIDADIISSNDFQAFENNIKLSTDLIYTSGTSSSYKKDGFIDASQISGTSNSIVNYMVAYHRDDNNDITLASNALFLSSCENGVETSPNCGYKFTRQDKSGDDASLIIETENLDVSETSGKAWHNPDHGVMYGAFDIGRGTDIAAIISGEWNNNKGSGLVQNTDIVSVKYLYIETLDTDKYYDLKTRSDQLSSEELRALQARTVVNYDPRGGTFYEALKYALGISSASNQGSQPLAILLNYDNSFYDLYDLSGASKTLGGTTEYAPFAVRIPANFDGTKYGNVDLKNIDDLQKEALRYNFHDKTLMNYRDQIQLSNDYSDQRESAQNWYDENQPKPMDYIEKIKSLITSTAENQVIVASTANLLAINMAYDASEEVKRASENFANNMLLVSPVALKDGSSDVWETYVTDFTGNKIQEPNEDDKYYEYFNGCNTGRAPVPKRAKSGNAGTLQAACISAPAWTTVAVGETDQILKEKATHVLESWLDSNLNLDDEYSQSMFFPWKEGDSLEYYTYDEISSLGQSVAAAYVVAAIALVEGLFPDVPVQDIVTKMIDTADRTKFTEGETEYADDSDLYKKFGAGLLDIEALVEAQGNIMLSTSPYKTLEDLFQNQFRDIVLPSVEDTSVTTSFATSNGMIEAISGALEGVVGFDRYGFVYDSGLSTKLNYSASLFNRSANNRIKQLLFGSSSNNFNSLNINEKFNDFGFAISLYSTINAQENSNLDQDARSLHLVKDLYADDSVIIGSARLNYQLSQNSSIELALNSNNSFLFTDQKINKLNRSSAMSSLGGAAFALPYSSLFNAESTIGYAMNYSSSDSMRHSINITNIKNLALSSESSDFNSSYNIIPTDFDATNISYKLDYVQDNIGLTFGLGILNEKDSLLGAVGSGALSFGKNTGTVYSVLGLSIKLNDALSFYGSYSRAVSSVNNNPYSFFKNIDNLTSNSLSLGLVQTINKSTTLGFIYSEPLRISNSNVSLSLPVGRTFDGEILYRNAEISFIPEGKERNLEFVFNKKLNEKSNILLNFLYTIDPNHSSEADDRVLVSSTIYTRF